MQKKLSSQLTDAIIPTTAAVFALYNVWSHFNILSTTLKKNNVCRAS